MSFAVCADAVSDVKDLTCKLSRQLVKAFSKKLSPDSAAVCAVLTRLHGADVYLVQGAAPLGLKLDTDAVLAQMSNTRLIQA